MTWEIVREGTGTLLAAEITECEGCEGGVNCPIDVYLSSIRHSPSRMNLYELAEQAGLKDIKSGIHLAAEGQYVQATCKRRSSRVCVVNTNREKVEEMNLKKLS
jgi:hypothetical protein